MALERVRSRAILAVNLFPDRVMPASAPHPAPGSGDSKLAESLQTLVRWLDRVAIEDGYVGVPVIEAVELVVNELRRQQAGGSGA
ncbi:hypothetical protein ACRS2I_11925 [Pseudomonas aeruginosa]|uniref:hypothetical protein n=1 Tax=Pseudomonas aeruginosa TaxID=287 RepID=UPI003EE100F3